MEVAFSSMELAEMGLSILPKSKQGIEYHAKKNNWEFIESKGIARGGKTKKYLMATLPLDVQDAIIKRQTKLTFNQSSPELPVITAPTTKTKRLEQLELSVGEMAKGLNDKQRNCALSRMVLVQKVLEMSRLTNLPLKKAISTLILEFEAGRLDDDLVKRIPIANARSGGKVKLSARQLNDWVILYKQADDAAQRLVLLAPKPTNHKMPMIARVWLRDFLPFHARPQKPSLRRSYADFKVWHANNTTDYELPSYDKVKRVWRELPEIMKQRGRTTGSQYKAVLPYTKRDWLALMPNECWIGDGHSFKAKVAHPVHGRPFKPEITLLIDACGGAVMGYSLSLAESTVAVSDAFRIAMKHNGIPLMYYSDNGGGQTGKVMDHDVTGLFAQFAITHHTGIPGNPQGRGIIERKWQDLFIPLAKDYATYVGKDMDSSVKNLNYRKLESAVKAREQGKELTAEQQAYKKQLPSWEQFMRDVAMAVDAYNNRPRSSLPKKDNGEHYTPLEYRQMRLEQDHIVPDRLTDAELDTLFRPQEIRTVERGYIRLMNKDYFAMDLAAHHGDTVRVAYDWDDASDVIVYNMDGGFICRAKLDGNTVAAFSKTAREQAVEKRKQNRLRVAQNKAAEIEAEAKPALEHQMDLNKLIVPKQPKRQSKQWDVLDQANDCDEQPKKIYRTF